MDMEIESDTESGFGTTHENQDHGSHFELGPIPVVPVENADGFMTFTFDNDHGGISDPGQHSNSVDVAVAVAAQGNKPTPLQIMSIASTSHDANVSHPYRPAAHSCNAVAPPNSPIDMPEHDLVLIPSISTTKWEDKDFEACNRIANEMNCVEFKPDVTKKQPASKKIFCWDKKKINLSAARRKSMHGSVGLYTNGDGDGIDSYEDDEGKQDTRAPRMAHILASVRDKKKKLHQNGRHEHRQKCKENDEMI